MKIKKILMQNIKVYTVDKVETKEIFKIKVLPKKILMQDL